jgi:hypothetical protein
VNGARSSAAAAKMVERMLFNWFWGCRRFSVVALWRLFQRLAA